MTSLSELRERVARLRREGLVPIEAVMSPGTLARLKEDYFSATPASGARRAVSGTKVIGLRVRLQDDAKGCAIRYFGGTDVAPD